jgi:hypothetical protein
MPGEGFKTRCASHCDTRASAQGTQAMRHERAATRVAGPERARFALICDLTQRRTCSRIGFGDQRAVPFAGGTLALLSRSPTWWGPSFDTSLPPTPRIPKGSAAEPHTTASQATMMPAGVGIITARWRALWFCLQVVS